MRTLDPAVATAIAGQEIWPVRLVQATIGSDTFRISDHYRDLTVSGNLYLPNGNLLSIDNVTNTTSTNQDSIEISVSAIDSTFRSDILDADSIGGEVIVYRGLISTTTGSLIAPPINIFQGIIFSVNISEEYPVTIGNDVLTVTGFSATADVRQTTFRLNEEPGRFTNDRSNRAVDSGDASMEFVAGLNGRNLRFGGPAG